MLPIRGTQGLLDLTTLFESIISSTKITVFISDQDFYVVHANHTRVFYKVNFQVINLCKSKRVAFVLTECLYTFNIICLFWLFSDIVCRKLNIFITGCCAIVLIVLLVQNFSMFRFCLDHHKIINRSFLQ